MSQTEASRPLATWLEALSDIDRSLAESLGRAPEPPAEPQGLSLGAAPLGRFDRCLAAWQDSLAVADRLADGACATLEAEARGLLDWVKGCQEVRSYFAARTRDPAG